MKTAKIKDIYDLGASIVTLVLEEEGMEMPRLVRAEGRLTIDALQDAFGDMRAVIGQTITYETDDIGLLAWFTPGDVS